MNMLRQNKRKYIPIAAMLLFFLAAVLFFLLWRMEVQRFSAVNESARAYLYTQLDTSAQAFAAYDRTGDMDDLDAAQEAVGKAAADCYAYGDSHAYRAEKDAQGDSMYHWVTNFLILVYQYLDDIAENGLNSGDEETLAALAEVFQPDSEQEQITFLSLFWNVSHSPLAQDPAWQGIIAENGVSQRLEF